MKTQEVLFFNGNIIFRKKINDAGKNKHTCRVIVATLSRVYSHDQEWRRSYQ